MPRSRIITIPPFPSEAQVPELIPPWLQVVGDVVPTNYDSLLKCRYRMILEDEERLGCHTVDGDSVCQRALMLDGNLGLVDAKRLLGLGFFDGKIIAPYIVFPGTILRVRNNLRGAEYIPIITSRETLNTIHDDVAYVVRYSEKDPNLLLAYVSFGMDFNFLAHILCRS